MLAALAAGAFLLVLVTRSLFLAHDNVRGFLALASRRLKHVSIVDIHGILPVASRLQLLPPMPP